MSISDGHDCYHPPIMGAKLGQRYHCSCGNLFELQIVANIAEAKTESKWVNLGFRCKDHKLENCIICSRPRLNFKEKENGH